MESQIDISKIDDIKELESLGYNALKRLESYRSCIEQEAQNARIIDARIKELSVDKKETPEAALAETA